MALKNLLQTFRQEKPEGILGKLDRYLMQLNGQKFLGVSDDRKRDVWHPSSLSTTECIRRLTYIWLKTPESNPDNISPQTRRIFDVGHHSGYQNQGYFWDMGILEGKYHCVECKHIWWAISPRECPNCGTHSEIWYNLHYLEVPVIDPQYNIAGHADGILNEGGNRTLLELKTIKNRDQATRPDVVTFDELNAAKIEHVYQMSLYMHILNTYGLDLKWGVELKGGMTKGIAVYSAKNNQKQKDFPVELIPEYVSPMYLKIERTNHALANNYLPGRISEDKNSADCKYCRYKDICHSGAPFEGVDNRQTDQEVAL